MTHWSVAANRTPSPYSSCVHSASTVEQLYLVTVFWSWFHHQWQDPHWYIYWRTLLQPFVYLTTVDCVQGLSSHWQEFGHFHNLIWCDHLSTAVKCVDQKSWMLTNNVRVSQSLGAATGLGITRNDDNNNLHYYMADWFCVLWLVNSRSVSSCRELPICEPASQTCEPCEPNVWAKRAKRASCASHASQTCTRLISTKPIIVKILGKKSTVCVNTHHARAVYPGLGVYHSISKKKRFDHIQNSCFAKI